MQVLSVFGSRGGVGTSSLAWALAREIQAQYVLDYSVSQGLGWVIAGGEMDFSWPVLLPDTSHQPSFLEVLDSAQQFDGIKVLSGGTPIELQPPETDEVLVTDGRRFFGHEIFLTTNSIQDQSASTEDYKLKIIRKVKDGIPISMLEKPFEYVYKTETSVGKSINHGLGLPRDSKLQKLARQICEDIFRDSSVNNR